MSSSVNILFGAYCSANNNAINACQTVERNALTGCPEGRHCIWPLVQTQSKRHFSRQCIPCPLLLPCPPQSDLSSFVLIKHLTLSNLPISTLDKKREAANRWSEPHPRELHHCGTGRCVLQQRQMAESTGCISGGRLAWFPPVPHYGTCSQLWRLHFLICETSILLSSLWGSDELNYEKHWAQT